MVVGVEVFTSLLTPIFVFTGYGEAAMMCGWLCMDWMLAWVEVGALVGECAVAGEVPLL